MRTEHLLVRAVVHGPHHTTLITMYPSASTMRLISVAYFVIILSKFEELHSLVLDQKPFLEVWASRLSDMMMPPFLNTVETKPNI